MNKKQFLLLLLPLFLTLTSCATTYGKHQPTETLTRDWSKFEWPPENTPCMMRTFYLVSGWEWDSIDFAGTWGDGEPFLVSFPITTTLPRVVRIEIHYLSEVIASKNFKPPVPLTAGTIAGWKK